MTRNLVIRTENNDKIFDDFDHRTRPSVKIFEDISNAKKPTDNILKGAVIPRNFIEEFLEDFSLIIMENIAWIINPKLGKLSIRMLLRNYRFGFQSKYCFCTGPDFRCF